MTSFDSAYTSRDSAGQKATRSSQPLAGVRVLDLTRHLPGPWATMTMADLGADVTKVERTVTGDTIRLGAPFYSRGAEDGKDGETSEDISVYFSNVNRNKKSLALDLKSDAGRTEFIALAKDADVVIENFKAGTTDRLGIGYEALKAVNPAIVYCAITGYGQTGDMAPIAGHDLNIAGMGGMLQMHAGQEPQMPGVLMGDFAGGTAALAAILAGLFAATTTGNGSYIDVSMLDALSSWSGVHMTHVFASQDSTGTSRSEKRVEGWGGNPRYDLYRTRDGRYMTVSLLERELWARFCTLFGREDLINHAETEADRLTTHGTRSGDYRDFVTGVIASEDRDTLTRRFIKLGLPICPVYTPGEWAASETAAQRECFQTQHLPQLGRSVPQMGFPFHMRMADGSNAFALRVPPPPLDNAREAEQQPAQEPHDSL